jgi:hypothetical protein
MIFVQLLLVNTVIITRKAEDANDLTKRKRFQGMNCELDPRGRISRSEIGILFLIEC